MFNRNFVGFCHATPVQHMPNRHLVRNFLSTYTLIVKYWSQKSSNFANNFSHFLIWLFLYKLKYTRIIL